MKLASKFCAVFLLFAGICWAQSTLPVLTGNGKPAAVCSPANEGQIYQEVNNEPNQWVCNSTWILVTKVNHGGTGSPTAAGALANLGYVAPPSPSSSTPTMNGTGAPGASANYSRADHVHPTDTSRAAANAVLPLAGGTMTGPLGMNAEFSNGTCTTAKTIASANGNRQTITLTDGDTCVLTFTQPSSGTISIQLKIIQSSSGSFAGLISGGKWPGGTVPTITATSGAVDIISCYLDGTSAYCSAQQNFQ